jgi:hypothetical protein
MGNYKKTLDWLGNMYGDIPHAPTHSSKEKQKKEIEIDDIKKSIKDLKNANTISNDEWYKETIKAIKKELDRQAMDKIRKSNDPSSEPKRLIISNL